MKHSNIGLAAFVAFAAGVVAVENPALGQQSAPGKSDQAAYAVTSPLCAELNARVEALKDEGIVLKDQLTASTAIVLDAAHRRKFAAVEAETSRTVRRLEKYADHIADILPVFDTIETLGGCGRAPFKARAERLVVAFYEIQLRIEIVKIRNGLARGQ